MLDRSVPAPLESIRRSSGEHVAGYIRRLIFAGTLRPGDRVPQDEVAGILGVSRIPVREALLQLAQEGWVTVELHRGAFVNAISAETIRDHYTLYGMICGFAARRALSRGSEDLPSRLRKISEAVARTDDEAEISSLSVEYHRTVLDEARNPRIGLLVKSLSVMVPGEFFTEVPHAVSVQKRGLAAITRAMQRRDGESVAGEYLKVMQQVGERVVELFEKRGLFG